MRDAGSGARSRRHPRCASQGLDEKDLNALLHQKDPGATVTRFDATGDPAKLSGQALAGLQRGVGGALAAGDAVAVAAFDETAGLFGFALCP